MLSPARSAWCTKKLNSTGTLIQRTTTEAPQGHMYYIGPDVHKKTISYCVKDASGQVHQEGQIRSNTLGTGRLDEDASATLDRSHGSNDFHRLDLRSSAPARSAGEGSASADAARHRCVCRSDRWEGTTGLKKNRA